MSKLHVGASQMIERLDLVLRRPATILPSMVLLLLAVPLQAGEAKAPATAAAAEIVAPDDGESAGCVESTTVMCLRDGRYEVTLEWASPNGEKGSAKVARPRTRDSGLFYFFSYNNWEVLLKVLDGCDFNKHHWVYAASATDRGLYMVVRDTVTNEKKIYFKEPGTPAPAITDSGAFPNACES